MLPLSYTAAVIWEQQAALALPSLLSAMTVGHPLATETTCVSILYKG